MGDYIDLTLSDGDNDGRAAKRQRTAAADDGSDDVLVVEQAEAEAEGQDRTLGEDEELCIVNARGEASEQGGGLTSSTHLRRRLPDQGRRPCPGPRVHDHLLASTQVWNQDLPHTRDTCGKHPFSRAASNANQAHCTKCFCFICDCPAAECSAWGTGGAREHHANAHSGDAYYQALRARRGGAAAAPAAVRGPAALGGADPRPALGGAAPRPALPWGVYPEEEEDEFVCGYGDEDYYDEYDAEYGDDAMLAAMIRGRGYPYGGGFAGAHGLYRAPAPPPPQVCNVAAMPDPSQDDSMLELARVELRCKAVGEHTLPDLRRRLVAHGFYIAQNSYTCYGDKCVCLGWGGGFGVGAGAQGGAAAGALRLLGLGVEGS